jgi:DNA-directed RNA polymerase specialized sigma24 family protein
VPFRQQEALRETLIRDRCTDPDNYVDAQGLAENRLGGMETRSSLDKITECLPARVVSMLFDAACGESSADMAMKLGVSLPTFQTRLSRARAAARKLAA